jgi:hypothetical protein
MLFRDGEQRRDEIPGMKIIMERRNNCLSLKMHQILKMCSQVLVILGSSPFFSLARFTDAIQFHFAMIG